MIMKIMKPVQFYFACFEIFQYLIQTMSYILFFIWYPKHPPTILYIFEQGCSFPAKLLT